jgi:uncharacterized protein YutE (UPF0331/DUF86 family)/predicted nucleotidyltransferase
MGFAVEAIVVICRSSTAAGTVQSMSASKTANPLPAAAEIVDRARLACAAVFSGTRVFLAYAHGSRVQGVPRPESDLDVGYYLDGYPSDRLPMAEEMTLADRLSRRLGVDIDLRNLGQAPLEWRARVLEQGCRLYCTNEPARVALERELMARWFDERPRLDRIHAERLAKFRRHGLGGRIAPMMVDRTKFDTLLGMLNGYVATLRRLAAVPPGMLLADPDKVASVKYHFVVAIECCLDLAGHVISSEKYRTPADSADAFTVLVERGVCPTDLEDSLRAMARFRNRLVHVYWQVDDDLVVEYLHSHLDDFNRYATTLARML